MSTESSRSAAGERDAEIRPQPASIDLPQQSAGNAERARLTGDELSLLQLSAILLANRWRILLWMLLCGGLAAFFTSSRPLRYEASASFIPQSTSGTRSGLSGLAGQFGLAIPTENVAESPEFYIQLLSSKVILRPIVLDTFAVPEIGAPSVAFLDLFNIQGENELVRQEDGLDLLRTIVRPRRDAGTGVVHVSVTTAWPSVSAAIATALVDGVHNFNQQTRQGQAAVERQFIESRLDIASADLRASEDRLANFLSNNRLIEASPQLIFERERLQRDIALNQQVFTTLKQAHEEARIREVRATPIITVLEAPDLPVVPEPRGRVKNTVLGLVIGGLIGMVIALMREMLHRARRKGGADLLAFQAVAQETRRQLFGWTRIFRRSA